MAFHLSYAPADGGNRVVEPHPNRQAAFDRACKLIASNSYRQFEILDTEANHLLEEPLIRRHCQGAIGLAERSE
jgi:hypothetical protein